MHARRGWTLLELLTVCAILVVMLGIGMTATEALGAACWDARRWLGRPALEHGASADLVCYADDPRGGAAVLAAPTLVMLRGIAY